MQDSALLYIITIATAWTVAQGSKYIVQSVRHKSFNHFRQLYLSGNMPSAHSSTVCAVTLVIGLANGFNSGLFGLSLLVASIVMYDAMTVRRSSGNQGLALQALIREQGSKVPLPRAAKGHSPLEVLVGAMLGTMIGFSIYFLV